MNTTWNRLLNSKTVPAMLGLVLVCAIGWFVVNWSPAANDEPEKAEILFGSRTTAQLTEYNYPETSSGAFVQVDPRSNDPATGASADEPFPGNATQSPVQETNNPFVGNPAEPRRRFQPAPQANVASGLTSANGVIPRPATSATSAAQVANPFATGTLRQADTQGATPSSPALEANVGGASSNGTSIVGMPASPTTGLRLTGGTEPAIELTLAPPAGFDLDVPQQTPAAELLEGSQQVNSFARTQSLPAFVGNAASYALPETRPASNGERPPVVEPTGQPPVVHMARQPEPSATHSAIPTPTNPSPTLPVKPQDDQPGELAGTLGSTKYLLAEQPKADDHYEERPPLMSRGVYAVPYSEFDFAPDPVPETAYDPEAEQHVYSGKELYANQRPLVELGKPWYQLGQIAPAKLWFGRHNPVSPQFLVYGDFRTGLASNVNAGNQQSLLAMRWNLDFDLRLTSTERFHWFMGPLDRGANFTRLVHDNGETKFISEFDPDIDFGYFEGDAGAIWGGLTNNTLPFDLPFAAGVMPLLFQNGVWLEDAFLGWAATIPARNSPALDISNMDITFFAAYDKVTSDAFAGDDHAARLYGIANFVEALGGYFELDYAFLEDRTSFDRSYHNTSLSYTRRYGRFLSNSIRMINNAGQSPNGIDQTADGTLLLFENSLISGNPLSFVPYFNGFIGFDRPQSAARAAASGGVLRNTGILFETDGLTGYPTLDATANNTMGGAVGLNMIAKDLSQQLIVEAGVVRPFGGKPSTTNDDQLGVGVRYQLPLSNSVILRLDSMYGWIDSQSDLQGYRIEFRKKW